MRAARIYPTRIVVALVPPVTGQAGIRPQLPANLLLVQAWGPASVVLAMAVHHLVGLPAQAVVVRRSRAARPVPPSGPVAG